MAPLISVYLPTRNRRALLSAAVSSVLGQAFSDLELIVVDDASSDDTSEFLQAVSRSDRRVRFLRNDQPQGAPASRNAAIRIAAGSFVTGLDDDDEFEKDRLAVLMEVWQAFARCSVATSCLFTQDVILSGGEVIGHSTKKGTVEFADLFEANYIGNQIFAPAHVFEAAGLFKPDLPAWQDLELFMRVVKKCGPARLVDVPLYRFDNTPSRDRISTKRDKIMLAYRSVASLHCSDDVVRQQKLFRQVFSTYGFAPELKDIIELARLGGDVGVLGRLGARMLRSFKPASWGE